MNALDDIRGHATALPDVEERTHFGRPAFRVRDKAFVTVHLDEPTAPHAIVSVGQAEATAAVADDPDTYEAVWRTHGGKQIFVGLRVDLARVTPARLRGLVEHAWRHKAPTRLVAAYDTDG